MTDGPIFDEVTESRWRLIEQDGEIRITEFKSGRARMPDDWIRLNELCKEYLFGGKAKLVSALDELLDYESLEAHLLSGDQTPYAEWLRRNLSEVDAVQLAESQGIVRGAPDSPVANGECDD